MALLVGSAVNQAGQRSGLTAPNGPAQTSLIRAALAVGQVDPNDLGLLSVHGTGTALGDPIEVGALAQALPGAAALSLASVKSCFGHTEGAAGLTGLLLATAAAGHQATPAVMHLRNTNPYVQAALGQWQASARRRVQLPRQLAACTSPGFAGTSSFGMSGVNAHAIVEMQSDTSQPYVDVLSEVGAGDGFQHAPAWCFF